VTLALAGVRPDGGPVPADVKHRSRLHWYLADAAVRDPADPRHVPGAVAVLTRPDGTAPDAGIGNVLAVRGNTVIRPRPGTVLEGISLGVVRELCERVGLGFEEADFRFPPAADIGELLLTGSGFGVAGVRAVQSDGRRQEFAWPGPACRALQAAWSELVGVDVVGQMLG
jgi:branched-chain amino acid aminotransferase